MTARHDVSIVFATPAYRPDDEPILSAAERARAGRYRSEDDRRSFVARWAFVRRTLGDRIGTSPAGLSIVRSPTGKPSLDGHDLAFSVSSSAGSVLVGMSAERSIGVDVEVMDGSVDIDLLLERVLTPAERSAVRSGDRDRHEAFFAAWTRKEAYVKATGEGLDRPGELDASREASRRGYELMSIRVADGFAAAVCVVPWSASLG